MKSHWKLKESSNIFIYLLAQAASDWKSKEKNLISLSSRKQTNVLIASQEKDNKWMYCYFSEPYVLLWLTISADIDSTLRWFSFLLYLVSSNYSNICSSLFLSPSLIYIYVCYVWVATLWICEAEMRLKSISNRTEPNRSNRFRFG